MPLKDASPGSAQALYASALSKFQSGFLADSQRQAESGFEQFRISNPAWAAKFRLLEAQSMLFGGMYDDALNLLAGYREPWGTDGSVEKLVLEAVALTRQQQTERADERIVQAEAICSKNDFAACGDALAARGILAAKHGRISDARRLFMKTLSFARTHNNRWLQVSTYVNLAYVALQVDHYDEAVEWSRSASQAAGQWGYKNLSQNAAGNLGWAYYELGDHERALDQFRAAEESAAKLKNLRYQLKWLSNAGYVYRDSGDWTSAAFSYRHALDLARQINSKEDIVNALQDLADISFTAGRLEEADSYIRQIASMEAGNGALHPSAVLLLTMGKLAEARNQYAQAAQDFDSVRNDTSGLMTIRLNAEYERARLFELQKSPAAAEQMYRSTLADYNAARSQLKDEESQLPFGTNAADIYDSYIHLLVEQGRPEEALAVADESRARTLEKHFDDPVVKKETRARMIDARRISQTAGSTLLFYWLGEKQSYLWAITPTKVALFPLPSRQQIAARVEPYRKALLDLRNPLESQNADGQALYQMLVAPAAATLRPNKPVILLTEGILSRLNFETLLAPGPASASRPSATPSPAGAAKLHYLIEDLTLSSAPSLAMLAAPKSAPNVKARMLLLGDPVSPNPEFPALPLFSFEMSRVKSHFGSDQVSVFGEQQATPAAYAMSRPELYSYIHFVSHAVASSTDPLDSAIILSKSAGSKSDSQEDSYKLYAREIIQHPIDAKLVTISACYGSGTRAYAGEGLVGLSWAFLRAGAHRVIGALWEVSDDSTPRMMDSMYGDLVKGVSPELALHNAKLALLHSHTRFRVPFYWAPFQMYGRQ